MYNGMCYRGAKTVSGHVQLYVFKGTKTVGGHV
jgi:hypothetical protein